MWLHGLVIRRAYVVAWEFSDVIRDQCGYMEIELRADEVVTWEFSRNFFSAKSMLYNLMWLHGNFRQVSHRAMWLHGNLQYLERQQSLENGLWLHGNFR